MESGEYKKSNWHSDPARYIHGGRPGSRILYASSDPERAAFLARLTECEFGYHVECVATAEDALLLATRDQYDLVFVDRELDFSRTCALELCRNLRQAHPSTNLIVLSASSATSDAIAVLNAGADDYVVRGTDFQELVARMRALFRRSSRPPHQHSDRRSAIVRLSGVILDRRTGEVRGRAGVAYLRKSELELVVYLHDEGPTAASELAHHVLKRRDPASRNLVHKHLSNARAKLRLAAPDAELIQHTSIGYALCTHELATIANSANDATVAAGRIFSSSGFRNNSAPSSTRKP